MSHFEQVRAGSKETVRAPAVRHRSNWAQHEYYLSNCHTHWMKETFYASCLNLFIGGESRLYILHLYYTYGFVLQIWVSKWNFKRLDSPLEPSHHGLRSQSNFQHQTVHLHQLPFARQAGGETPHTISLLQH